MNYPQKNYDFIKLKYFAKLTKEELTKKTKLNIKEQGIFINETKIEDENGKECVKFVFFPKEACV